MASPGTDRITITVNELVEALQHAASADNDAQTVQDLCHATGMGEARVREALLRLAQDGRLIVTKVRRPRLDGANGLVPAYSVKAVKPVRRAAKKGR